MYLCDCAKCLPTVSVLCLGLLTSISVFSEACINCRWKWSDLTWLWCRLKV